MESYVALLRAVNVGGNNKLPMKDLAAMCEGLGCRSVSTYIQSGNVLFQADKKTIAKFARALEAKVGASVITRSASELQAVFDDNPFPDTKFVHVAFLSEKPSLTSVASLAPACLPGEEFVLKDREIYFYLPLGSGNSKLASYNFGKKLGVAATVRNWRTVVQLLTRSLLAPSQSPAARRTS